MLHIFKDLQIVSAILNLHRNISFFSYFIMPHSYIPPSSGLGTVRLTSILIKQVIVYRFVCLFICSAMGSQTATPNGLKVGG